MVSPGSLLRCPQCATVFAAHPWEDEEPPATDFDRGRREDRRPWDRDDETPPRRRRSRSDSDFDDRDEYRRGSRLDVRKRGVPVLVWVLGGIGLCLFLACGLFGFAALRAALAADWKDLTSPDGGFTATFPATPQKKNHVDTLGNTTHMLIAETKWGHVAYCAAYTDLPGADNADANEILDAVTTVLASIKSKRSIRINGHPASRRKAKCSTTASRWM